MAKSIPKTRQPGRVKTKSVVTVSEMAALVGLSRSRFYELVRAGVFPPPVYEMFAYRAVYIRPLQRLCLHVRRKKIGINGQPVRFRRPSPL